MGNSTGNADKKTSTITNQNEKKDAGICKKKKEKLTQEKNSATWGNKPESPIERNNIKEISTKGERIQTKQNIPKEWKKILSIKRRRWQKNLPTIGCKRNRTILDRNKKKTAWKRPSRINNMTREFEGLEEGPKAEIHIDLLKTTQKI